MHSFVPFFFYIRSLTRIYIRFPLLVRLSRIYVIEAITPSVAISPPAKLKKHGSRFPIKIETLYYARPATIIKLKSSDKRGEGRLAGQRKVLRSGETRRITSLPSARTKISATMHKLLNGGTKTNIVGNNTTLNNVAGPPKKTS